MSEWMDIKTAPKDQWILAYQPNGSHGGIKFKGGHCFVCRWAYDDQFWYDKTSNNLEVAILEDVVVRYLTCVPTNWMELPEEPK